MASRTNRGVFPARETSVDRIGPQRGRPVDSEGWQQVEALLEQARELEAAAASFLASPAVDVPLVELIPEQHLASELVGRMLGYAYKPDTSATYHKRQFDRGILRITMN